jgi:hypothetical protein
MPCLSASDPNSFASVDRDARSDDDAADEIERVGSSNTGTTGGRAGSSVHSNIAGLWQLLRSHASIRLFE